MASPVLLDVSQNKVISNNEGIGGTIFVAVANLIISLCAFINLVVANSLKSWNRKSCLNFLYRCSKLLVHVCAILQSVLAYMVVLIKLNFHHSVALLVTCILFNVFPVWWSILSFKRTETQDEVAYAEFDDKLEKSLDILASVTSFLFQMLVAMSLESQASNGQDNSRGLMEPLVVFTFIFCLFATCCMLAGAILWPIQSEQDQNNRRKNCDMLCNISHVFCLVLTIFLSVVVPMVTKPWIDIEWSIFVVVFPWILIGLVFLLCLSISGNVGGEFQAKPAPLGLTKAMFAGFMSLLIPSLSSGTVSSSTTSGLVISGLLWRLLSHFAPMKVVLAAADAACLLTLLMVICAGISFLLVAKEAFAQGNITCQAPCTSSLQIHYSILNCVRNTMTELHGQNWTSVVSRLCC